MMGSSIAFLFIFIICCYKTGMIRSVKECWPENEACFSYTFKSIEDFREQLKNDERLKNYLRENKVQQLSKLKTSPCSSEETTPKTGNENQDQTTSKNDVKSTSPQQQYECPKVPELELLDLPFLNGTCTYLSHNEVTYSEAENICQKVSNNSELASFSTIYRLIQSIEDDGELGEIYWTGLSLNADHDWVWPDGTSSNRDYTEWLTTLPQTQHLSYDNDCAELNILMNSFTDSPCSWSHKFLCQHNMT